MKDYILLTVTRLGYTWGLLNLSIILRRESWNPILDVWRCSFVKVSLADILTHTSFLYTKGGPQAFLGLSAAACMCPGNTVLGDLEEGCLRWPCFPLSCSLIQQPFVVVWEWQRIVSFSGALVERMPNLRGYFFFSCDFTSEFQSLSSLFLFFFPLQKELMESCQDHELINLMKVKTMPAEQGMILIKTNRIFCLFFFLASPDSNRTVGKKGLLQFNILQFVS